MSEHTPPPSDPGGSQMPQTRWSLIVDLRGEDGDERSAASAELCRIYRRPVFIYIRSRGLSHEDAEDLTQELFARFMANNSFASADPAKGKLRSYIYTAARRLVAEHWRRAGAASRGGGSRPLSLDDDANGINPSGGASPEQEFDRLWAEAVLAEATRRLREHYASQGKSKLGEALEPYLGGDRNLPGYAEVGPPLGLNEGAMKLAVRRMRQRLKKYIEQELAETLRDGNDLADELIALKAALRRL